MERGGAIARYRTAIELLNRTRGPEHDNLFHALMSSPIVQRWLANVVHGNVHASCDNAFENAMGKLIDMGLRAGMSALDMRVEPFLATIAEWQEAQHVHATLMAAIILGGLVRAGYDTPGLRVLLHWRLDMLCDAVKDGNYDIYASNAGDARIPHGYRRMPLVKSEFCEPYGLRLPYVHDLLALSHADALLTPPGRKKVRMIVAYVLDPRYQALHRGYGCLIRMSNGKPHCNAIGWSAHLPGYQGFAKNAAFPDLLFWVELMSHFKEARQHPWFRNALDHLDAFRTPRDTWLLPASYLQERTGYYVLGAHMRLDPKISREHQSTLRMLCLKHRLRG